jgi:hypothetical protein
MNAFQRTVCLEYQLDREKAQETGILLSAGSGALIFPGHTTQYPPAVYNEAGWSFLVDFDDLEPDHRYLKNIFPRKAIQHYLLGLNGYPYSPIAGVVGG